MKLIEYVAAHIALMTLVKKEFPFVISYKLFELRRRIAPKVSFYQDEERALAAKFAKSDGTGKPDIKGDRFECRGDTPEEAAANAKLYMEKRRELENVEDHEAVTREVIRLPANMEVSPEVLWALSPFIIFEVDDGNKV